MIYQRLMFCIRTQQEKKSYIFKTDLKEIISFVNLAY